MNYRLNDIEGLLYEMSTHYIYAVDTETNGLNPFKNQLIGISFFFPNSDNAYYVAFRHGQGVMYDGDEKFEDMTWQKKARKLLFTQQYIPQLSYNNLPLSDLGRIRDTWNKYPPTVFMHNSRFDLHFLQNEGFDMPHYVYDTLTSLHLILPDWRVKFTMPDGTKQYGNSQLKWQSEFWGFENAREGEAQLKAAADTLKAEIANLVESPKLKNKIIVDSKSQMWLLKPEDVGYYAALDTHLTYQLFLKTAAIVQDWGLIGLMDKLNQIQTRVAYNMERTGFVVDIEAAHAKRDAYLAEAKAIADSFPIENINSNPQLLTFFKSQGLDVTAVNKQQLDNYASNEWVMKLRRYRNLMKAANTYLKRWIDNVDASGTIHPTFNPFGTGTGRWASGGTAGNFQNIPSRAYNIKEVLKPQPDYVFVALDYAQLELRLATWIAEGLHGFDNNMTMTNLFNSGEDMHAYTRDALNIRSLVWGSKSAEEIVTLYLKQALKDPEKQVAAYARFMAKTANFGLIYGGGKGMLSKLLKLDLDTAQVIVEGWRATYPAFMRANQYYHDLALRSRPQPNGKGSAMYIEQPISGFIKRYDKYDTNARALDKLTKTWVTYNQQEAHARKAWNWIVQGLGGYMIGISGLRVQRLGGVKMSAAIHDALELQIHKDELYLVKDVVRLMTDWDTNPGQDVAWEAGVNNWQDLKVVADFDLWVSSKGVEGYATN